MAKFLVLIYGDEQQWAEASEEWGEQNEAAHRAFAEVAGSAILGGHELEPASTAVSLRGGGEKRLLRTDGPFVETKEGIGGYYLLEAPDLKEAVRLASMLPEATAPGSGVEVRRVR
ncbi:MAG: hypothetical protein JWM40_1082 [Frankiales bacterium]|nr:hypothetical protein [Frankiales bacterium]